MSYAAVTVFYITYSLVILSVISILYTFAVWGRRFSAKLSAARIWRLSVEELNRLLKGNSIDRMHFAIVVGLLLSIAFALLGPVLGYILPLLYIMLAITVPVIFGLLLALAWRLRLLGKSGTLNRRLGGSEEMISSSGKLQVVLIIVISFTIAQLVVEWLTGLGWLANIFDAAKNMFIAVYYARPSMNLIKNFDRPVSFVRAPFDLKKVQSGEIDASGVKMGVDKMGEFGSDVLASSDSCVEIGACEAACPATATGRPLSPRVLVRKASVLREGKGDGSNPFEAISDDEVWSCTTCGACVNSCPVGVDHLSLIYSLRRTIVEKNRLDQKKSTLLMNLMQGGNSMGISNYGRNSWIKEEFGVSEAGEGIPFEYLLWVGCMPSFDERSRQSVRSFLKIMKEAGLLNRFAYLGGEETCCGDPARRLGEDGTFQNYTLANIELFEKYNVKKLVVLCAHGYNTFTNDYPTVDPDAGQMKVYHESQLIEELINNGRIRLKKTDEVVALHDPCYLARYNGVVEPQRAILSRAVGVKEPKLNGERTFCCGAGGANYWYDVPEEKRISHERLDQLGTTGVHVTCMSFPCVNSMLSDAAGVKLNGSMKVVDISQIVEEHMEGQGR
ncbi:MAG: (Fe-S)-binding protein [Nitrososphaerota archaeon]|nr:(Fe-S)-binding protein [Nitrososphaerota archaeon]